MTKSYVIMDATGVYVEGAGVSSAPPQNATHVGTDNPFALTGSYLVDGTFVPRPLAPTPVATQQGYEIAGCPAITRVTIIDTVGSEVLARVDVSGLMEFALTDPGTYEVRVKPPLPFLMSKTILEV